MNTTMLIRLLPVDTAEILASVPNHPTTRISTAPYIVCRMSAPRIGTINPTSFLKMLPVVKSIFCFSAAMPFPPNPLNFDRIN